MKGHTLTTLCLRLLCMGFVLPPAWVVLIAVLLEEWERRHPKTKTPTPQPT